jgi:starvation-inducible outer membrane lipoprotein
MAKKNKTYYDLQHNTQKTNDPRTPLKTGSEIRFSGRVDFFYFTSGTRRITVITNPLTSPGRRKDVIMVTTNGRNTSCIRGFV